MKLLKELLGIKKYSTDTISNFLNQGIESGSIKVRSGSFAFVVIPKDANYVYKVWTVDPGWEEYLAYIQDHPGDPHLLRVMSRTRNIPFTFKRPSNFDVDMKIVKLEKLRELSEDESDSVIDLRNALDRMIVSKLNSTDIPGILKTSGTDLDLSFIRTTVDVLQKCNGFKSDLHGENVMKRADGTLVITDPYFEPHNGRNVTITASDLLHGKFYGQYSMKSTSGRSPKS